MVMGIIGGTLTGPLIFILPPLLYRRICQMEARSGERTQGDNTDDIMMGNEDGDEDKIHLNPMNGTYGTFTCQSSMNARRASVFTEFFVDSTLAVIVIIFGVIATFASTYFNFSNVSAFKDFWTPCIYNITTLSVIDDL